MKGTTTGPRSFPGTPASSAATPAARPHASAQDDVELARREARALLGQLERKPAATGQKASSASGERRRERKFALLERRKGELWTYGQVVLCVVLLSYLAYSLLR